MIVLNNSVTWVKGKGGRISHGPVASSFISPLDLPTIRTGICVGVGVGASEGVCDGVKVEVGTVEGV